MELRKAQNTLLLVWGVGVIPLVAWLFLTITDKNCASCFWTPLSYATPPLSMMVLVFFNRDSSARKISKDHYRVTLLLSVIFLLTIIGALLSSIWSNDPLEPESGIIPQFEKFNQLLTFILGLTMAGLGVVFSKSNGSE